jgi:hypothetical protein
VDNFGDKNAAGVDMLKSVFSCPLFGGCPQLEMENLNLKNKNDNLKYKMLFFLSFRTSEARPGILGLKIPACAGMTREVELFRGKLLFYLGELFLKICVGLCEVFYLLHAVHNSCVVAAAKQVSNFRKGHFCLFF